MLNNERGCTCVRIGNKDFLSDFIKSYRKCNSYRKLLYSNKKFQFSNRYMYIVFPVGEKQ